MAEPYNPVLAGAGYVHALMIQRFGLAVEHVGVIDQGAYVWFMKPPGRSSSGSRARLCWRPSRSWTGGWTRSPMMWANHR
jgi:hypothetical protein